VATAITVAVRSTMLVTTATGGVVQRIAVQTLTTAT